MSQCLADQRRLACSNKHRIMIFPKSAMKANSLWCAATLLTLTVYAADSAKDEVVAAAKKLGEQPNYSWNSTVVVPEGTQFRPGPTEGKTDKDGLTYVKSTFGDFTTQTV